MHIQIEEKMNVRMSVFNMKTQIAEVNDMWVLSSVSLEIWRERHGGEHCWERKWDNQDKYNEKENSVQGDKIKIMAYHNIFKSNINEDVI